MINNRLRRVGVLAMAWAISSCNDDELRAEEHLQGVIELEERALAFEVPGRIHALEVERGDRIEKNAVVARMDDELERTARAAREAEVQAAKSQTDLLEAGTRPEEIRSMAAQVRAAKSSEALLEKSLARERTLLSKGVSTQAAVDELESRLSSARENRRSLANKLAALRKGARPEEIQTAQAKATVAERSVQLESERIERHVLRAPMTGTVLDVHARAGEVLGAGTPVVTLGDTRRPYVDVFVPTDELAGVKVGASAQVRVESLPEALPARVDWISRTTEFTPRFVFSERERANLVIRVRLVIEDPDSRLHAGVPAFASIQRGKSP